MKNWSNVRALIDTLHGRWVVAVLHNLRDGPRRHKDLLVALVAQSPDRPIKPKVLSETLTMMCQRGLLVREEVAPHAVEYSLTHWGQVLYQATGVLEECSTRPLGPGEREGRSTSEAGGQPRGGTGTGGDGHGERREDRRPGTG